MNKRVNNDAMNFLNDVAGIFPNAISLAAGRPATSLLARFSPELIKNSIERFLQHSPSGHILQYGDTAGAINELISQQLKNDYNLASSPSQIIVTSGCQEALYLAIQAICSDPGDTLLVCNPVYAGATGAAAACGVNVYSIKSAAIELHEAIDLAVLNLKKHGRRARAIYLVPDFDNPTGSVLSLNERLAVLRICTHHRILILEDNAYRNYRYAGNHVSTIASLDTVGSVLYLNTYSKTLFPSLRVGSLTLPHQIWGEHRLSASLKKDILEKKSYLTVNTSQLNQAIVGGILLHHGCTLAKIVEPAIKYYRKNMEVAIDGLHRAFGTGSEVSWNCPEGGFFLTVNLPFDFGEREVSKCAEVEGVIVMPMQYFSVDQSYNRTVRFAVSSALPEEISQAVARFGSYVSSREIG